MAPHTSRKASPRRTIPRCIPLFSHRTHRGNKAAGAPGPYRDRQLVEEGHGAKGGTRTPTPSRAPDPKSGASANSATLASRFRLYRFCPVWVGTGLPARTWTGRNTRPHPAAEGDSDWDAALRSASRRVFAGVCRKLGTCKVDGGGVVALSDGNGPQHAPPSQKRGRLSPARNPPQNLDFQFRSRVEFAGDLKRAASPADIGRGRRFLEGEAGAVGSANPHFQGYGDSALTARFDAHEGLRFPVEGEVR